MNSWRLAGCASGVMALAVAVLTAAPAHADEATYVAMLEPRYASLTADELRAEGYRICAVTQGGMPSSDAMTMVQEDLGVSVPVSIDIVVAAVVNLC